jgi:ATP-dependent Clp protease, protease subunit
MKTAWLLIPLLFSGCAIILNQNEEAKGQKVQINYEDPVLNNRQILIFGDLNQAAAEGAIQKLLYLDKKGQQPIDLFLFTPGGDLKSAFSIEQVMQTLRSPVNTYALGECNSGGAFLLAAGTGQRVAFSNALIVVHGMVVKGKPPVRVTDILQDYYTTFWKRRAHLPDTWLPIPQGKVISLTAQEALKYGLVDKIIEK